MNTLIGISGSLRRSSYNSALLRAALELAPPELRIEVASIRDIPLYDGDVEAAGLPPPVAELKERIAAAHGLLLVSPEYNHSLPGVFKNAIDWLSRPAKDIPRVFGGKPLGLIGATPGLGGTRFSQTAWLPVFAALGVSQWHGKQLFVSGAAGVFDAEGQLVDAKVRGLLGEYLAGLSRFVAAGTRAAPAPGE